MPKQLFQRPAHVNRSTMGKPGHPGQQTDWSRKKGKLPKVKAQATSITEPNETDTSAPTEAENKDT